MAVATFNLDKMMSPSDVASMLGDVQTETIQRYCLTGIIHAQKIGRSWWIPKDEAKRFVKERKPRGRPKK